MTLVMRQQGYMMIVLTLLMASVGALGVIISYLSSSGSQTQVDRLAAHQAMAIAQGGLERGTFALLSPNVTSGNALSQRYACSGLSFANVSLGEGEFSLSATGSSPYDASTQLADDINASDSVIPVESLSGFAPRGRVMINQEKIDYYGTSASSGVCGTAPCLINVYRGRDGTDAVSHDDGDVVSQWQCDLEVTAGVPLISSANGKRQLMQSVQLQTAWVVGHRQGNDYQIGKFNGLTWQYQNGYSNVGSSDIYAIDMINAHDGWAVGDSEKFYRWNGSSWFEFDDNGSVDVNGISCINHDSCWAVGDSGEIYRYSGGNSWSKVDDEGSDDIYDVQCLSENNCWAVGEGGKVYRYTGGNWSLHSTPSSVDIWALDCVSSSSCWAVGYGERIYRYNGSSWVQFDDLGVDYFRGIDCVDDDYCWAVGDDRTFAFYNGSAWNSVSTSVPSHDYYDVACFTKTDCWAVGGDNNDSTIVHYDGSSWSNVSISGFENELLRAIDIVGPQSVPQSAWEEVIP